MKSLSELKEWSGEHKTITSIVCVVLIIACCAGVYFGWREYEYRQSSEYALVQLKDALNPPQPDKIAQMVDFNSVSQELAQAIKKYFPFFKPGPDQLRTLQNLLQSDLLKNIMEGGKGKNLAASTEADLKKDKVYVLPPDFVGQMINNLKLSETSNNSAVLTAQVHNDSLDSDFTLVLTMAKTDRGWIIQHVANADELAQQARQALIAWHTKTLNAIIQKNMLTSKRMQEMLPIQSCAAHAGFLSDGRTFILAVQVLARNQSNLQVNNFNLDTNILGKNGQVLIHRNLNTALPLGPGENFNHTWQFDLEGNTPLAHSLLRDAPLQCKTNWNTLGLSNGEVLHIKETPDPGRPCAIPDHNHPENFCLAPIFTR